MIGQIPASNQLRTSSEPASVMEFGFNDVYWQATSRHQCYH